jgi:hypothetical protein
MNPAKALNYHDFIYISAKSCCTAKKYLAVIIALAYTISQQNELALLFSWTFPP